MVELLITFQGKCLQIVLLLFRFFTVFMSVFSFDASICMVILFFIDIAQEAYWSMASALSEADGVDYTDPDEV